MCNLIAVNHRDTVLPQYCNHCTFATGNASSHANKQHAPPPYEQATCCLSAGPLNACLRTLHHLGQAFQKFKLSSPLLTDCPEARVVRLSWSSAVVAEPAVHVSRADIVQAMLAGQHVSQHQPLKRLQRPLGGHAASITRLGTAR